MIIAVAFPCNNVCRNYMLHVVFDCLSFDPHTTTYKMVFVNNTYVSTLCPVFIRPHFPCFRDHRPASMQNALSSIYATWEGRTHL